MSSKLSDSQLLDVIYEWKNGIHFSSYVPLCRKAIAADRALRATCSCASSEESIAEAAPANVSAQKNDTEDGESCKGMPDALLQEKAVAWQGRTFYPQPEGEGWGQWREVHEMDLATFKRRMADRPDHYQLRGLYTRDCVEGVLKGWKRVPVEITDVMHVAAVLALRQCRGNANFPPRVYAAFLANAPEMDSSPMSSGKVDANGKKTLSFDLTEDECFVWDGAPSYPMVTCRECKATDYGITRLEHQPGCRVAAAFPAAHEVPSAAQPAS